MLSNTDLDLARKVSAPAYRISMLVDVIELAQLMDELCLSQMQIEKNFSHDDSDYHVYWEPVSVEFDIDKLEAKGGLVHLATVLKTFDVQVDVGETLEDVMDFVDGPEFLSGDPINDLCLSFTDIVRFNDDEDLVVFDALLEKIQKCRDNDLPMVVQTLNGFAA